MKFKGFTYGCEILWVLISTFFPVMVPSTVGAYLLVLAEPRDVAEAEAFKASGNYDKFFDITHVPVEFDFPESN
jgi:hypothetical protein